MPPFKPMDDEEEGNDGRMPGAERIDGYGRATAATASVDDDDTILIGGYDGGSDVPVADSSPNGMAQAQLTFGPVIAIAEPTENIAGELVRVEHQQEQNKVEHKQGQNKKKIVFGIALFIVIVTVGILSYILVGRVIDNGSSSEETTPSTQNPAPDTPSSAAPVATPTPNPTTPTPNQNPSASTPTCCDRPDTVDSAGNPFGVYRGTLDQSGRSYSVVVTYTAEGIVTDYPELSCGHDTPVAVVAVGPGFLKWNEILTYGTSRCVDNGDVSLTKQTDSELWDFLWTSASWPGIRASGSLDFECSHTCEDDETTITPSITVDAAGNPFGVFRGRLDQSNTGSSYDVVVTYTANGIATDYPELKCGHDVAVIPITVEPGYLEWNERLTYGISLCVDNGEVSLAKQTDNELWDFLWTIASSPGIRASGSLDFECSFACDGTENP